MRIAVLASGRGSNLTALIKAIEQGRLTGKILLVMSNKTEAGALQVARQHGIPSRHLTLEQFDTQETFDNAFLDALAEHQVNMIALAGYLKRISPAVIHRYKNRILNIHPALLPAFGGKGMYGKRVHQAVLDYGCRVTGVTVHLVDEEYDTGPPVLQRCVPVEQGDTVESLAARVLEQEHLIYAEALQLFAEKRVDIQGRRVHINPPSAARELPS
ncbi:MAG: phosphoribosylglycinamide formyltransferase [bacterium]